MKAERMSTERELQDYLKYANYLKSQGFSVVLTYVVDDKGKIANFRLQVTDQGVRIAG